MWEIVKCMFYRSLPLFASSKKTKICLEISDLEETNRQMWNIRMLSFNLAD